MHRARLLSRVLPLAVAAVVVLASCGSDESTTTTTDATTPVPSAAASVPGTTDSAEDGVVLDAERREATVSSGATIEVVLGLVNSSIGDDWRLANVDPAGAVELVDERYEGGDCPEAGAGCADGVLTWVLRVTGTGTVSFDADNCYRGSCPGDPNAEEPAERRSYTLTVEP